MKPRTNVFIEYLGWYGAIAIVTAYGLYAFGVWEADNIWYHLLNLTGATGIIVVSIYKKAWQPAVVNVMWVALAAYALYVYLI
ncbi:MAG TPA: hypothetical protein VEA92_00795 [Candidatus Paceibacterota bacterium]|nr:hypothetical protein [Candidatus Paceibacterota bacterium]